MKPIYRYNDFTGNGFARMTFIPDIPLKLCKRDNTEMELLEARLLPQFNYMKLNKGYRSKREL